MKPYQKKYKRKAGKKNTPWTEADLTALRTMHQQGSTYADMANTLDRSTGGVAQQLHKMKKRDAAEGYIHVSEKIRTNGKVTKVALTKAELQVAKMVGLTPEQYAHGVILAEAVGNPHVSDTLTTQDAEYHATTDGNKSPLKRWWKRLFGRSDIGAQ